MGTTTNSVSLRVTAVSLIIGSIGAGLAYMLSFPVYILTGPAVLVTILSLTGMTLGITPGLRNAALLMIGIGIGSGVNDQATEAFLRWPVAFLALAIMLIISMTVSRRLLTRWFGYAPAAAVLAATPGHLSFVMSLSTALGVNVAEIALVQSVRLFSLTLIVPFAGMAMGLNMTDLPVPTGDPMRAIHLIALIIGAAILGLILARLRVPAPLLIGGLVVSSFSHVTGVTPGPLNPLITLAGFLVIGTLIGTRFSGISFDQFRKSLLAGLLITVISSGLALIAALPISVFLDIPLPHVLVAFAPGGLETMVVMGAVLGANPGFVAACHVARLLMLIGLLPMMLPRTKPG